MIRIKQIIIVFVIFSMIIGVLSLFGENIVFAGRNENTKKGLVINDMQIIKRKFDLYSAKETRLSKLAEVNTAKNSVDFIPGEYGKYSYGIQELLLEQNSSSQKEKIIEVVVYSQFDQSVKDVVTAIEKVLKDVEITIRNFDSCRLFVTTEQFNILNQIPEVRRICLKSETEGMTDYTTEYTDDEYKEDSGNITPQVNSSSEMLGVKKARQDFGVTGDLDGRETVYTKNDVVIAVIDTGIDIKHVDLDGGKVIGWYDAINGTSTASDSEGHGTHVASIIAGTGEGDPIAQKGYAPGAALVGVKVLPAPANSGAEYTLKGLQWIYNNIGTYNIDAVNMSIGTHASYSSRKEVIDMINKIANAGVPVFVSAGNEGDDAPYYDSLSTYAKYTATSIGSIRDPYEGGWCLSSFSSRGSGRSTYPYIVSCGQNVRAAASGTTNGYTVKSGTSMAAPTVAGTFALMYDAAYSAGGGTIRFAAIDMGEIGTDKNYGGGRIDPYTSIKDAAGATSGSFNTYRNYIVDPSYSVSLDQAVIYQIKSNSRDADLNISAIVLDEATSAPFNRVHLAVWEPGSDPYAGDVSTYLEFKNNDIPQTHLTIPANEKKIGTYYVAVIGAKGNNIRYTLEITGHEVVPN